MPSIAQVVVRIMTTIMTATDNQTASLFVKRDILSTTAASYLTTISYSTFGLLGDLLHQFAVDFPHQLWPGTRPFRRRLYFQPDTQDPTKTTNHLLNYKSTLMKNLIMLVLAFFLCSSNLLAQSTAVTDDVTNTSDVAYSEIIVNPTTMGFAIPQFDFADTASASAVSNAAKSLSMDDTVIIFDENRGFYFWKGTDSDSMVPFFSSTPQDPSGAYVPFARMKIHGNGNVGIGTEDPDEQLVVYNGITTGKYTSSGWTHSSDIRLKKSIGPLAFDINKVLSLEAKRYDYKSEDPQVAGAHIGFIAQEVELLFPEFIHTGSNGYKAIAYGEMVPVLVEAIKVQQADIEQMKHTMSLQEKQLQKLLLRILELEYAQGESANR